MDKDMEYKVKLVTELEPKSQSDFPIGICRISPKGLLLIIGISLILILAVPYSGIFSKSHKTEAPGLINTAGIHAHHISMHNYTSLRHNPRKWKPRKGNNKQCDKITPKERFDCHPERGGDQTKCEQRRCCWQVPLKSKDSGAPSCFFPLNYPTYKMSGQPVDTDFGYRAKLMRIERSPYPMDITQLQIDVYMETDTRVHFKIIDPSDARYEVPIATPKFTTKAENASYRIELTQNPFGIAVIRNCGDIVLFNSTVGPLIYSDQFIQLSSTLVSKYIYGLGERRSSLRLSSEWKTYTIWSEEPEGVRENQNLYGSHPFYLNMEPSTGQAHGVFLLNSNAMDIVVQPTPAITYRTIGGVLDFYIFLGPSPSDVIAQYTEVIGRPFMPPYWGLGFQLCRWGYMTANKTWDVVKGMRKAGIPQDVQWNDIEYATDNKIFTYNNSSFSNLPEVVKDLHDHGQHYIQIVDPGIHNETGYAPYDNGLKNNVFVTDRDGNPLIGKVWPGTTAFQDFFHDDTKEWWKESAKAYHEEIPFDGMWIDMNEPANVFANGSVDDGCPNEAPYDNLPYMPAVYQNSLIFASFCLSSNHHNLGTHFNLHSLYGYSMLVASNNALTAIRENKRPFVITRSTFPSSGAYGGHWLGDNYSEWPDMYFSIPGILAFNMYGIPLVGADICGFNGNTTEPLCQRWTQLGAFYPFSRNHNSRWCPPGHDNVCNDQDPTVFSEAMQNSTRKVLLTRYSLLPYLYTLFYRAHINGSTVARPLFFEFPKEIALYDVDKQFLWGPALLISPVLKENATSLEAVFPKGLWYDFYNGSQISVQSTTVIPLKAPLDHLNLHVRAGYILPTQEPNITTTTSRLNRFGLTVALQVNGTACGELFWDDGDSLDSFDTEKYTYMTFEAVSGNTIQSKVIKKDHEGPPMLLGSVRIFGVSSKPAFVKVNDKKITTYKYDVNKVLEINCTSTPVSMQAPFTINWGTKDGNQKTKLHKVKGKGKEGAGDGKPGKQPNPKGEETGTKTHGTQHEMQNVKETKLNQVKDGTAKKKGNKFIAKKKVKGENKKKQGTKPS